MGQRVILHVRTQVIDGYEKFVVARRDLRFYSLLTGTWTKGNDVWTANDASNANLYILGPSATSEIFIGYDVIDFIGPAANHELSVRAATIG